MPTPIGHSLSGILIYLLFSRTRNLWRDWKWALFAAALAAAPDLDFIPGWLLGNYNEFHRGISHSLGGCFFISASLWGLISKQNFFSPRQFFIFLMALYGSHLVLDFFARDTAPPYGGKFLWPFSNQYFISPVPLFLDLHREPPQSLYSLRNIIGYISELVIFGVPLFFVCRHNSLTRS